MDIDKQIEAIIGQLNGRRGALVIGHMGLGDQLVSYGVVDALAGRFGTVVLCCRHEHAETLTRMYQAEHSGDVLLLFVSGDADIAPGFGANPTRITRLQSVGLKVVYTYYIDPRTRKIDFDLKKVAFWKRIYANANVPESACLSSFKRMIKSIKRSMNTVPVPTGPYVVIHEDPGRGMLIKRQYIPTNVKGINLHGANDDIVNYIDVIVNASEYHGFDSSFAWLVHLGGLRTHTRKFFHAYVKAINDTKTLYPVDTSAVPWTDLW